MFYNYEALQLFSLIVCSSRALFSMQTISPLLHLASFLEIAKTLNILWRKHSPDLFWVSEHGLYYNLAYKLGSDVSSGMAYLVACLPMFGMQRYLFLELVMSCQCGAHRWHHQSELLQFKKRKHYRFFEGFNPCLSTVEEIIGCVILIYAHKLLSI